MTKKTFALFSLFIVMAMICLVWMLYPNLPDKIATHWGISGTPDGYSAKTFGVWILPIMVFCISLLFMFIPKIDPINKDFKNFSSSYYSFSAFLNIFLFYIFTLMIAWNLGWRFNLGVFMVPALAILWFIIAVVIRKADRNFFFGIRTPWTLSSDLVWQKTHKLGSNLFIVCGIISLLGMFTNLVFWLTVIPVLVAVITTVIYSYFVFKKYKDSDL